MESSLRAQFRRQLKLLYDAQEQGLAQSLANSRAAAWPALRKGVQAGRGESLENYDRLRKVFAVVGLEPGGSTDLGMRGILDANRQALAESGDEVQRDIVILASAQTAVRYYLGRYRLLKSYGKALGYTDAVRLLTSSINSISRSDKLIAAQNYYLLRRDGRGFRRSGKTLLKGAGFFSLIVFGLALAGRRRGTK